MLKITRPTPSHFGIFATDVEKMVSFYKTVFGLTETDRGGAKTFKAPLVFLSANPDHHHQLVIADSIRAIRTVPIVSSNLVQPTATLPPIEVCKLSGLLLSGVVTKIGVGIWK